jgi:ketosteroid isomerase-like protein
MRTMTIWWLCTAAFAAVLCAQGWEQEIESRILAMERGALDRWCKGDPSGFLEISAPDVVYFDPFQKQRLDGHQALSTLYESVRGQVEADRYEILNPKVQAVKDMAVLTFNFVSYRGASTHRWNCTEVYRLAPDGQWQIIQTHWSITAALSADAGN